MLRNYYKVNEDCQASIDAGGNLQPCEIISVEKGDIIVDVKQLDDKRLIGKMLVSQKVIQIPKQFVEELRDDCEMDDASRSSSTDEECNTRRSIVSTASCKRKSADGKSVKDRPELNDGSSNGTVSTNGSREEEVILDEIPDEYVPITSPSWTVMHPKAPPRTKKKLDKARETFRSRESDEGYNSCSHYSGEKPSDNDHKLRSSYYNTPDVPVLSSFGGSPQQTSSPRPSIQDADGYEIPSFVQRASVVNGEVATGDEKGVTLKFVFQRKSTSFDEKVSESFPLHEKFRLGSIGENTESAYESWETQQKVTSSLEERKIVRKDRLLILLYFSVSIIVSLAVFFVLFLVSRTAALLSFTAAVNLFAIVFVGFLTMSKRRWLCIAALLAPSLFSKKVKIGLCITLCVVLIAGPLCNVSSNLMMVFSCKDAQNASEYALNTHASTENSIVLGEKGIMPASSPVDAKRNTDNTTISLNETNVLLDQCKDTLLKALTKSVSVSCTGKDAACVMKNFQPRFDEVCKNLSTPKGDRFKTRYSITKYFSKISKPNLTFSLVLLQCLPLLLLLILHEAYWYNRGYLSDKEMDNVYITGKLKALDLERRERGTKHLLFPLRKLEFRSYVLPSSFLQTSQEAREIFMWIVVWISLGITVLLCVLLDKNVLQVLLYLSDNSSSNCDIEFSRLDQNMVYSLCIMLALLITAIIFQSYVLRCRSRICSYFYPKKESTRGVFLYHKILHDRTAFWKACRNRGRMLSEGRRTRWKIGICHRLFRVMPNAVRGCIEKLFIYRCMICDSLTFRKSFICCNEDCSATFCYECFIDMGQSCISCRPSGARDSVFASL